MEEDDGTVARLNRRRCFGPCGKTSGNTLTSKEVFTWAKSNNRRLLHVGGIDRRSKIDGLQKFYICRSYSMWLAVKDRVESADHGDLGGWE
uniref:Uncharacterized protein n=1 Tax=Oryza rufipogon TaxID=4529 RepID=A0A0E0P6Z4_ORYRU